AYAQYPVCNPSRTSFLTGLRCEQTGVVDNRWFFRDLIPAQPTMPQWLRQEGWWAGSYGKILHVGEAYGEFRSGWMDEGKSWDDARMFNPAPASLKLEGRNLTGEALAWCYWWAMDGPDDAQPDGQNAAHAVAAIEERSAAGKPWFAGVGFHRPHDPFVAPKKYFDLYPAASIPLHRDPAALSPPPPLAIPSGAFLRAFRSFSDQERFEYLRAYYAGVSFMDAQVGRLLDTLDRLALWENTLVIFLGDHGYHLGEREWWNKNTLFERSCRAPLIIAAPEAKGGGVCETPVEFVDLFPTVMDYCGVTLPTGLAGQSLRPQLEDPAAPGKGAAFTLVVRGGDRFGQAVHTPRWHFNKWSDGAEELYDLDHDPEENNNLAGTPGHETILSELREKLTEIGPYTSRKPAEAPPANPAPEPVKDLILPGESFLAGDRPAFIFWPEASKRRTPQPWIFYAPALPGYPDQAEKWMHEQILAAGVAVAGIDVGEAYGSPASQEHFTQLYQELTGKRGFAAKPCLLGRSRGGLWVSSWAAKNSDKVSGLAGIYPVFDLRTYPGLEKAAPAYGLSAGALGARLAEFNPIEQTGRLAEARIPVCIIHGDADTVVPLEENSAALKARYETEGAGDIVQLIVAPGQGHNFWEGFFRCEELVRFAIARARAGAEAEKAQE
ncbi:MAG TPA: sulfatase-like hydrolase/transferase, partial [Verrucomicrobiales bacterium]|nr:sulfatase-like hydrolase/transferase [Verrucomicrobiales bacterium]